jgi:hypothetical protein
MKPEDMKVYQVARELGKLIDEIVAKLSPKLKRVADHMERSMESGGRHHEAQLRPGDGSVEFVYSNADCVDQTAGKAERRGGLTPAPRTPARPHRTRIGTGTRTAHTRTGTLARTRTSEHAHPH